MQYMLKSSFIPIRNLIMKKTHYIILPLMLSFIIYGCGSPPSSSTDTAPEINEATPTPTTVPQEGIETPDIPPSPCEALQANLEMQILVGPADAVGLEPYSVGTIPFSVTTNEPPYLVQGGGQLAYADALVEDWGTYEVTLNMVTTIDGECVERVDGGELHLSLEMTGSQMVEVTAEGFHGNYPWEGTVPADLVLPLEDGASMEGEGYIFVLHLLD